MADLLVAAFVVCDGPDAFPHTTYVVVLEVLLNALPVPVFCQLDPLSQFFAGPAVSQFVSGSVSCITLRFHQQHS